MSLASFFMGYHFCLKEQLTGNVWLMRFGHLADIVLKMKELNLLLPSEQLLVTDTKLELSLKTFPIAKDLSDEIGGDVKD